MMTENQKTIIKNTATFIRDLLAGEGSGHDWWHIQRVWNNAKTISEPYQIDLFVVEMAALIHDIADHKFHNGDESVGLKKAEKWLDKQQVSEQQAAHILQIMQEVSFSKGKSPTSLEGEIVQDADRLDAIGAIGIARAFAYGGFKNREMYNPDIPVEQYKTLEDYKKNTNPTLNHFYEKLLLLKDMMNTQEAKKIAAQRHKYMEQFLEQFYNEWDGRL